MTNNSSKFDLADRTFTLAFNLRVWIKSLPKSFTAFEDIKQLVRSSGSVAANYIEADESLSKDDFKYRIKICRKESKESMLWLRLLLLNGELDDQRSRFVDQYGELVRIFNAILKKCI